MFKGMKTTLAIFAMSLVGMVACTSECVKEGETTCDSTEVTCDTTKCDSVTVEIAGMVITVTDSVSITDVVVEADAAQ